MKKDVKELLKNNPLKLSVSCIDSRLRRGWSEEKTMNTKPIYNPRPKRSHPFKDASYIRMAQKKGWDT